ncbi:hypothetical protein GGR54DRAFT_330172 [Hypoxylon sp. NC1633]|nr:hypothetical protein GGR54DRAFT_330172 [Hypoxylon sp. NC1633]
MSGVANTTAKELLIQWQNPGDILSLLLLIGGDIVQRAIAQLTGCTMRPFGKHGPRISISPVAFSFGWVAFGFTSLMSAVGAKTLMPAVEKSAIIVNCANSFVRQNQSWLLERLLRDYETYCEASSSDDTSFRVDIFELGTFEDDELPTSKLDRVWWYGCLTILTQLSLAIVPWVLYDDWGPAMIFLCGTLLALITSSLPQWSQEKWSGRRLDRAGVFALTRGNGHRSVMIFIGSKNSWNLELMATANSTHRPETTPMTVILAILWLCLLLCTSGLKANAWYLIGIGLLGMTQNIYAAGAVRGQATTGLKIKKSSRIPTIVGRRINITDDPNSDVDVDEAKKDIDPINEWLDQGHHADKMPPWLNSMTERDGTPGWLRPASDQERVSRTQGALKELEKWVPGAGLALLKIYFPGNLDYDDRSIRDNVNKKFWKRASHTKALRRRAELARRENEENKRTVGKGTV